MEYSDQVVDIISQAVVKAIDQRLAEYTIQLEKKLKNILITGDNIMSLAINGDHIGDGTITGDHIANATITGGNIVGMTITGDLIVDGTLTGVKIQNGTISTSKLKAEEVEAEIVNAMVANIAKANIDWANVKTLNADQAVIREAIVNILEAEKIVAGEVYAGLADIATAIIGNADIDYAHIKDMSVNTALISKGVGGKFFFDDLAVVDANIVSLLVNKLYVQDEEGNTYNIFINEDFDPSTLTPEELAKLPVMTKRIQIDGGGVVDGSLPASAIVKNSITANEINAGELFANEAFVNEMTAGLITTGQLFANEAVIGELSTRLITSDYLSIKIQDEISREHGNNLLENASQDSLTIQSDTGLYQSLGSISIGTIIPIKTEIDPETGVETIILSETVNAGDMITFRSHLKPINGSWCSSIVFLYDGITVTQEMEKELIQRGFIYQEGLGAIKDGNIVPKSDDGGWSTVSALVPPYATRVGVYLANKGIAFDTCIYHSPKLEKGAVPTAWEDSTLDNFMTTTRSEINQTKDSIAQVITRQTEINNELGGLSTRIASSELTPERFTTMFADTVEQSIKDEITGQVTEYKDTVKKYLDFSADGTLTIGYTGNDGNFRTQITSREMAFMEGNSKVAYISGRSMYITDARVTNTLSIGNETEGYFDWIRTANGLGLKWRNT